jgi:uncharacterized membrane protein
MSTYPHPAPDRDQRLSLWFNRRTLWLSQHWLLVANGFFLIYVSLPLLAPLLMASGLIAAANGIYQVYNLLCHQIPTRTFFIFGEQVAMCHRCLAIYASLFVGGVAFGLARFKQLPLRWYVLFALPMAVDGASAFVSELSQALPLSIFWALWSVISLVVLFVLYREKMLLWQFVLIFVAGFLALAYLQIFGPRLSNVTLRTLTGAIFGIGTVWFAYPILEEGFKESIKETSRQLARFGQAPPVSET